MPFTYAAEFRAAAVDAVRQGKAPVAVAGALGCSTAALYEWLHVLAPELVNGSGAPCFRCATSPSAPPEPYAYAHLLGLYLGDGHLRRSGQAAYDLSISCADAGRGSLTKQSSASPTPVGAG